MIRNSKTIIIAVLGVVTFLGLAGCGSENSDTPLNISGTWVITMTPAGTPPVYAEDVVVEIAHAGSAFTVTYAPDMNYELPLSSNGVVSGTAMTFSYQDGRFDPAPTITLTGAIASNESMSGTFTDGTNTGTWVGVRAVGSTYDLNDTWTLQYDGSTDYEASIAQAGSCLAIDAFDATTDTYNKFVGVVEGTAIRGYLDIHTISATDRYFMTGTVDDELNISGDWVDTADGVTTGSFTLTRRDPATSSWDSTTGDISGQWVITGYMPMSPLQSLPSYGTMEFTQLDTTSFSVTTNPGLSNEDSSLFGTGTIDGSSISFGISMAEGSVQYTATVYSDTEIYGHVTQTMTTPQGVRILTGTWVAVPITPSTYDLNGDWIFNFDGTDYTVTAEQAGSGFAMDYYFNDGTTTTSISVDGVVEGTLVKGMFEYESDDGGMMTSNDEMLITGTVNSAATMSGNWVDRTDGNITGTWTAIRPPAAFTTTAPAADATGVSLTPTFTWNASDNATSYTLEIADNTTLTNIVVTETNITGTLHTLATPLAVNTTHSWRVTAVNAADTTTSNDGSVIVFTTVP